ncbi:protein FAM114A2 [Condylostylus longicornis]|uniref:protein FAM114A2 n=1 Tax=Condylostylus longicornis TaxID=2530218 RepID=UPI00244DDC28|nr:protein FAM114A2 [Condylostylus longicornis]
MSDSEEFLSAEEDYEEFEKKPENNARKTEICHRGKEISTKVEKVNIKLKKDIKTEPELESEQGNTAINILENDMQKVTEKICNLGTESDSEVKNVNENDWNGEDDREMEKNDSLKSEIMKNTEKKVITPPLNIDIDTNKISGDLAKNISSNIDVKIEARHSKSDITILEEDKKFPENFNEKEKIYQEHESDKSTNEKKKVDAKISESKDDEWDFDDWNDDDKICITSENKTKSGVETVSNTNCLKQMTEQNNETPKHGEILVNSKEKENDDTAWDDFDDNDEWIATDTVSKDLNNSNNKLANDAKLEPCKNNQNFKNNAQDSQNNDSWNGWKPWGGVVTSLLSTATEGVTSLTTHVSQVLENSIGIPEPEELVKINQKLEEQQLCSDTEKSSDVSSEDKKEERQSTLIGLVSGVTTIGNKVITGGLDTLEGIGKKTMNILQENDPLLLNKRRIIGLESSKPNLSQVLREAKEKSEEIEKNLKQAQKQSYKKQLHFETLFDHYYGLVHLEALEMLSRQCDIKIQSLMTPLSGKALDEMKETLNEVKELCDLEELEADDHDEPYTKEILENDLKRATQDFGIPTDFTEILECWEKNLIYLQGDIENAHEVFEKGLRCLAETCALQMNKMHKIAELLIIKESHTTVSEADSLVQITTIFSRHLRGIANKFCGKLNTFEQTEEVKTSITNIFVEVYNSTSYVQSAFKLFIPILQVGAA